MRRTPLPPDALDGTDRAILNTLQSGFPLTPKPFATCGTELGISERDLIARIGQLREIGAITRFGPFFDAEAMGGAFCLCAMAVPRDRFEEVVTLVNAHVEVAHNYERDHHFNMWFVLACERQEDIAKVAEDIGRETGIAVKQFPKLKEFYIGFRVDV